MPILLDTHVALWAALGDVRRKTQEVIDDAAANRQLLLSPISAWELAMLASKKRVKLDTQFILSLFSQPGVTLAPMTPSVAVASTRLAAGFHGDPADRILIATALEYGASLVTRDAAIVRFARTSKTFQCIPC